MINLMFCGNNKVFDGMIISLLSIAKHTNEALNVFILTMDLRDINKEYLPVTQDQIDILEKIVKSKNEESKVTLIDTTELIKNEIINSANIKTHYTPYIFIRLFSDKVKELPNKILYLDCDIVCYRDIKEIFENDMEGYEIGVATDYIGRKVINKKYINSGVVLMNLEEIRKNGSFEKARKIAKTRIMAMPDQTALYRACKEKLYLPDKCNEQKSIKLWHIDRVHNEYKIFDYEDILEEYLKIKEESKKETVKI